MTDSFHGRKTKTWQLSPDLLGALNTDGYFETFNPGESSHLSCVLAGELWPAFTDAHQVENALLNLAISARYAMPAGGRMTITTRNVRLDEADVAGHEGVQTGDYVAIDISDTGMSAEVLAKAVEPFFTTKPVGEGTARHRSAAVRSAHRPLDLRRRLTARQRSKTR